MPSDEALVEQWRAGDTDAGETLFDRHFKALTRFFRHKVGEDGGMDDLIQQTFVRIMEGRDRFRGEGTFRSYLYGVAYNVLREHHRARHRDGEPPDFSVASLHDLAPRPSERLDQKRDDRLLLEALRRIPLEHQVLLELYFWEPLPAPRIADVLDVPEGTVRTRLRRAKQLLERELRRLAPQRADLETTLTDLDAWARSLREQALAG